MRRFFLFFAIIPFYIDAQINETFGDGDFTQNPTWRGSESKFIIDTNQWLQLIAPPEASNAWLFTQSTAMEDASWAFEFTMDFNPSSSNYAKIWIAADNHDPAQIKNGMVLNIGASDDAFVLQSVSNGKATTLIKGLQARLNREKINAKIRISRDKNIWTMEMNMDGEWIAEGSTEFNPSFGSEWFGILCNYTQTRSNKFWFDNIVVTGNPRPDNEKPYITSHLMKRPDLIEVQFNEPITTEKAEISFSAGTPVAININQPAADLLQLTFPPVPGDLSNEKLRIKNISDLQSNTLADTTLTVNYSLFRVSGVEVIPPSRVNLKFNNTLATEGHQTEAKITLETPQLMPDSVTIEGSQLTAYFPITFEKNQPHTLQAKRYVDVFGNTMAELSKTIGYHEPARNSMVITEFMPDPDPPVGLPNSEYIELFNNTPFDLSVKDWQITVNQTTGILPSYTIPSQDYVILCPLANIDEFATNKKLAPSRWPTITNAGASIVLSTPIGIVADAVSFDLVNWSDQSFKEEGGWSFEIIDIDNRSANRANWSYTGNLDGGTPSKPNSNQADNPDKTPPAIHYIKINPDLSLKIQFTEPVVINELAEASKMTINGRQEKITVNNFDPVFNKQIIVSLEEVLEKGTIYRIDDMLIKDLAGNRLVYDVMARYGLPEEPEPGDAVVNEIMFNTAGEAPDFVEIVNTSQKVLSLNNISIGKMSGGVVKTLTPLTINDRLFFPNDFMVATPDSLKAVSNYNCDEEKWVVGTTSFPSLSDDGECLVLAKTNGEPLESFCYDKKMHHPLLKNPDGISLERVDPRQPANNRDNWQTASASSGYSTPTAINSQYKPLDLEQDNTLSFSPAYFTPDGDGVDDYLMIQYRTEAPGWNATIKIYGPTGHVVKTVANNEIMGMEGFWLWNGLDDNNEPLNRGNYLVLVKMFNLEGKQKVVKKSCTLGVAMKK
ncbi:MAG: T9SS type B sorting domain-containing protein [Breznakibacter sp.]